ncbi:MAG: hypothetical protein IJM81_05930 [Prevotella sp.]|nr:hypothetical protein [Prevotella sp.]
MKEYIEPTTEKIQIDINSLLDQLPTSDTEVDPNPDDWLGKKNLWDDDDLAEEDL